jgi:outer membrane protein assembly factor BamB
MVLVARSAFNGLPLWRSTAAGWGREACATAEHLFMPRPKEGKIVAYRGQTGEEAFVIETAGRLVEELAADDQCLYATTWNEKRQPAVECFDADTGKARWKSEGVGGAMTLGDDAIYLPGKRLLAIEKRSGATRWEASDLPVSVEVAFATPSAVIVSKHDKREEGQVIALAVKDGRRLWSAPLPPAAGPRPAFPWQGGVAILGARYDLQTGKATGPAPPSKQANCAANIVTPHGAITRGGTIVRGPDAADTIYFGGLRTQCGDAGMVANGMLYAGPTLCGCNSSGRVEGFPAFGAAARPPVGEDFQKPRPVLAGKGGTRPFVETEAQWPTYRHDPQRSGGSPIAVPPRLAVAFSQKLSDRPGGPVASSWASQPAHGLSAATLAGGLVYLADSESHRVIAVSAADGRTRWSFRADGRVDSPPTIHRGRCLFGSRDGWVYCLRADDGELVWRSRAAPAEQFLVAYGQIESAWPVPGCVAVIDDVVVAAAGRTWNVDGGIAFCGFRLDDGATAGAYPSGSRNDIPVSDGRDFYVQGYKLSADRPKPAAARDRPQQSPWEPDRRRNEPLLEGHRTGLLDATITLFPPWPIEWRATYKRLLGCSYAGTSAWLAVWNGPDVFYYDTDFTGRKTGPQRLFAKRLPPVKGQQPAEIWSVALPADCRVDAMLAASDALVAAGASGIGTEAQKGMVWVYRRRDGAIAQQVALPGVPVFQSLSAAPGQIFVSTTDGRLVCLAAAN